MTPTSLTAKDIRLTNKLTRSIMAVHDRAVRLIEAAVRKARKKAPR